MLIAAGDKISGYDYKLVKLKSDKFEKLMMTQFPAIYQQRNMPMQVTCMCWGFEIGPGWYPLIYDLSRKLQCIYNTTGLLAVATQVKEKFGTLRYYYSIHSEDAKVASKDISVCQDIIASLIDTAENNSEHVCDVCGKYHRHTKIDDGGWIFGACKECLAKRTK